VEENLTYKTIILEDLGSRGFSFLKGWEVHHGFGKEHSS
jgi:hypothetical protein